MQEPLRSLKNPKWNMTTQNATKNYDYTAIADWLRTVNWSNDNQPTGVAKPVYGIKTFQPTIKAVSSKGHILKFVNIILLIKTEDEQQTKAEGPLKLLHDHIRCKSSTV